MIRIIYLILGFLFMGLGAVGVVLPVLPTTPFLLLASYFFAKGSKRFHNWFTSTKLYRNHLEDFVKTRAMTRKTKLCILLPASTMMIFAMLLAPIWHAKVAIGVLIVIKYYYFIFRIKTIKEEPQIEG